MAKTAFIYPGQGAQHVGMGKDVAERYAPAAAVFREADAALGINLSGLIFGGDEETLKITENTQPALLTVCTALTAALMGAGGPGGTTGSEAANNTNSGATIADGTRSTAMPYVAAGLSIGEYAAHVLSGTFSFFDAVKTVRLRGRFMQDENPAGTGGMAAIMGLDAETVESCCQDAPGLAGDASLIVEPANYNCPGQIVISGHASAVEAACGLCKKAGAKRVAPLAVSAPFHCSLMRGAGIKLASELDKIAFGAMDIPVVSNVDAEFVTGAGGARAALERQVASPVRWEQSIRKMIGSGVTTFVEIGPGKTLAGFIKRIDAAANVINVSDCESLESAKHYLATNTN